jgi:hypothetical protein
MPVITLHAAHLAEGAAVLQGGGAVLGECEAELSIKVK